MYTVNQVRTGLGQLYDKSLNHIIKKARKCIFRAYAPPPGLEPGTCGLTVRRSNRLS